jgi:hypothetical protein
MHFVGFFLELLLVLLDLLFDFASHAGTYPLAGSVLGLVREFNHNYN